jgi:hypothetical protein
MPYADPEARRAASRRHYERQQAARGRAPARARRRAPEGLPDSCDGWALQQLEHMSRAECARRLGITRQAVEQAEISGLKKLAAMRGEFEEYL